MKRSTSYVAGLFTGSLLVIAIGAAVKPSGAAGPIVVGDSVQLKLDVRTVDSNATQGGSVEAVDGKWVRIHTRYQDDVHWVRWVNTDYVVEIQTREMQEATKGREK